MSGQEQMAEVGRCGLWQRSRRIALAVVIGLALLAAAVWCLVRTVGEHETMYEGRSVYHWLTQLHSADPAGSNAAYVVFNRAVLPDLVRTVLQDTNDSNLRLKTIEQLNGLPGVNIAFRTAAARRGDAADVIGEAGLAALNATPALLQGFRTGDPLLRPPIVSALSKLHAAPEELVPLLIRWLDNEALNETAALCLAQYGPQARDALPKLHSMSDARDKSLHRAVALALKAIEPVETKPTASP